MAEPLDGPSACTWKLGDTSQKSVHTHEKLKPRPKILDTVLDAIGQTPMVRLNRVGKTDGVQCELLVKCEFFNAGGSVKDRIGRRMVLDAEASGRITPGDTLIEPTSGNTGIGLALAAAIKGYRMVITLPEKMSQEKVNVLKALGAEIIRTPTEAAWNAPESHIGVASRLNKEIPRSHILDQYKNPSNPLAHYDTTAEEILEQCDGKLDAIVMTAGTGGTITGIARKLKERLPNIKVIGVDPNGSILAQPESLNGEGIHGYFVEGIGYDFIPTVLDRGLVDEWIKTNDKESFVTARRLIREEGLLCGGSSGAATWAAIQYAKTLPATARVVVLLADSIRNYIVSKFANDEWMRENGFVQDEQTADAEQWWWNEAAGVLALQTPYTVLPDCQCKDAITIMKDHGFDQLPVVDDEGRIVGTITEGNATTHIVHRRVAASDPVSKVMYKQFRQISASTTLGDLSRIFDKEPFALVVASQKQVSRVDGKEVISEKKIVTGVATRMDLLNYILRHEKK